ncbi:CRISPR-associated endonuclease Cas2 [Metamycoplasma neophronis]|nr:CRISPR-associated endonuclease Cas2 [Metamycoplasma neophronis]
MRILIMYDIQMDDENVPLYNKFRQTLIKLGYVRLQYSIYVKCIANNNVYEYEKAKLIKHIPKHANIRIISITESQYQNMEILAGEKSLNELYLDEKIYIEV